MMQEGDYISFQKASAMLADRLSATREEVALWAWLGKRLGGFDAYISPMPAPCRKMEGCGDYSPSRCDGFAPPLQYGYPPDRICNDDKPWTWLVDAYFLAHDIESFSPSKVCRFISWSDLLTRWQAYGLDESEIRIKVRGRIHDDELTDIAPLFGGTVIGSETGAPPSWAMFPLADIEAIEAREFSDIRGSLPVADENGSAGDEPKVGAGATAATVEPETKSWILSIQAEAARRWKLLREAGANPTKNNIKDDLAKWCRESNVVTGGGINPTAEYIYRHALRKWTPPTR